MTFSRNSNSGQQVPIALGLWNDPLFHALDIIEHPFAHLADSNTLKRQGALPSFPPVNISETDEAYKVTAEIPGFKKDEISVDVLDRTLTLKGEHKERHISQDESHLRIERSRSSVFERSIRLPNEVDASKVNAVLDHGILEVSVRKLEATTGGRVAIPIQ